MHKNFHQVFIPGSKIKVIAKSAKVHPAAKNFCGWEEPAICHMQLIKGGNLIKNFDN